VGLNVIEEKRLAFEARGIKPMFEQLMVLDHGKCRLSIAVPDDFVYKNGSRCKASASQPPIQHPEPLLETQRHQSGNRDAVRRS